MSSSVRRVPDILILADSGTWGDEGDPGTGSPVLRSSNIQDGRLDLSDLAWRIISANDRQRYQLAAGDILVTKSSGSASLIGKCCVFDADPDRRYYFSNFTLRLRTKADVADFRWVYYWLTSERGRAILNALNNTTTGLRNLNVPRYLDQELPLPPLPEQHRLANSLNKADVIRRKRQQAIALTEQLLRSTFLEMFGDPVTNPKSLPTISLGDLMPAKGAIVDGPFGSSLKPECYVDDGVRVVRNYNISDDHFDNSEFKYVTVEKFLELQRSEVVAGDLLMSTKGTLGNICIMPPLPGQALLSASGTVRLRLPDDAPVLAELIVQQMIQPSYKEYLRRFEGGTNQKYLNLSSIRKMEVLVPPMPRQREFLALRARMKALSVQAERAAKTADNLFNSLVQRAFSGQL